MWSWWYNLSPVSWHRQVRYYINRLQIKDFLKNRALVQYFILISTGIHIVYMHIRHFPCCTCYSQNTFMRVRYQTDSPCSTQSCWPAVVSLVQSFLSWPSYIVPLTGEVARHCCDSATSWPTVFKIVISHHN